MFFGLFIMLLSAFAIVYLIYTKPRLPTTACSTSSQESLDIWSFYTRVKPAKAIGTTNDSATGQFVGAFELACKHWPHDHFFHDFEHVDNTTGKRSVSFRATKLADTKEMKIHHFSTVADATRFIRKNGIVLGYPVLDYPEQTFHGNRFLAVEENRSFNTVSIRRVNAIKDEPL